MYRRCPKRKGFTLIELLVVIAIIAILIALLVPAVQKVREAAARTECQNNLKQIGLAIHNYADQRKKLPPGGNEPTKTAQLAWTVFILPYIEQDALYQQYNFTQHYNGTVNKDLQKPLKGYICPSANFKLSAAADYESDGVTLMGTGHYYGVSGTFGKDPGGVNDYPVISQTTIPGHGNIAINGLLFPQSEVKLSLIPDGTSNTLMVGELSYNKASVTGSNPEAGYRPWARGYAASATNPTLGACKTIGTFTINERGYSGGIYFNHMSFGSNHSGGCNFLFGDGSVRFLNDAIDFQTYRYLGTRGGGEPTSNF